ncbi:M3 family metallopeptidase, partial [Myxococcota bacterium]
YLQLVREYHGEAQGAIRIDPLYAVEWAFIPHFYYNFYMFQYTTSFVAATAIADRIYAGDAQARTHYLKLLKAGGSRYPVQLLKTAGVDMTASRPYKQAFLSLKQTLDEIEELSD